MSTSPATEIARAASLDAEARHDEAINQLALAAQRGDIEATTLLAKRIIVGDRAPRLRRQGIGLLTEASDKGGAEAAARLAVVHAAGVGGTPDWPKAVRLLMLAADRGFGPARAQLAVLMSMVAARFPGASAASPALLLEEQALRELLEPPPGRILHDDPRICVFPRFLNDTVCEWLIERARGRLERARVYDAQEHTDFVDDSRTNSYAMFNAMEADIVHLLVQARMSVACGQPMSHMEASTVLHYGVGETIGNHYDFVDPAHPNYAEEIRRFGHRVVTFLAYLNEGYESGETDFPKIGVRHAGRRGEGLYFVNTHPNGDADIRTLHSGRPPTRGEKWVFSQFIRNRPEMTAS